VPRLSQRLAPRDDGAGGGGGSPDGGRRGAGSASRKGRTRGGSAGSAACGRGRRRLGRGAALLLHGLLVDRGVELRVLCHDEVDDVVSLDTDERELELGELLLGIEYVLGLALLLLREIDEVVGALHDLVSRQL